jgi:hypothetical protein
MGSKNKSPYPGKKPASPTPRTKPPSGGTGGPGGPTPKKSKCWDFVIVSPTQAAAQARKGLSVDGIPQGSRVMIHADIGVLGYAPATASREMISASRATGGTLSGDVTALDSQRRVSVHVCVS